MMQPRSYQIEAVMSVPAYFKEKSGNPVIAMPTGTGKSVVIAMLMQYVFHTWPGQRVMILTHVKELIEQNHQKLIGLWPSAPAGVYSSGLNRKDVGRAITFAGIGSVAKKAKTFGHIDLVLIDEAHMVSPSDETLYRKFLADLKTTNPNVKVIGLTATPWRLGQGRITSDGIFTDVCFDITNLQAFNRLVAAGYLAPLVPRQTKLLLDIDGVHMRGGELIASELQTAVDKSEVTYSALKEACEAGHDRKHWLAFASGVEHAIHIADMLNDMGVPAIAIHSKMGDAARDQAIKDFKSGKYRCAVNNNVLTTGFDFPAIDLIIMLRPTASTVLWVQMLGRGTRPWDGKANCLVLDFAGNTRRLGPINDPVIPRKKGDKAGGEAPVKLCGACGTYNHASVRHCAYCGQEFTFAVKINHAASSEQVMKGDAPIVEAFKVDHMTFSKHEKMGRPPMMKVTYYCGLRSFSEYVCIQHEGFAQRKARIWWKERGGSGWENQEGVGSPVAVGGVGFPETTEAALAVASNLRAPTHVRIWVNKQYPEILAYCFDGTAFGTQAPSDARPTSDTTKQVTPIGSKVAVDIDDDDIPF